MAVAVICNGSRNSVGNQQDTTNVEDGHPEDGDHKDWKEEDWSYNGYVFIL